MSTRKHTTLFLNVQKAADYYVLTCGNGTITATIVNSSDEPYECNAWLVEVEIEHEMSDFAPRSLLADEE